MVAGAGADQVDLSGLACQSAGCVVSWSSPSGVNSLATVTVGGRRWSVVGAPPGEPDLGSLVCFSESCLAEGRSSVRHGLFSSSDGGRLWSFRSGVPGTELACWSRQACVFGGAVTRPGGEVAALAWSRDGGRTWRRVAFPVAAEPPRSGSATAS